MKHFWEFLRPSGGEKELIAHFLSSTGTEATVGKRSVGYRQTKKKENRKRKLRN